jgi:hypothetical protein
LGIAAFVTIAEKLGFLNNGLLLAAAILSYTVGTGIAVLRFFALDTDMKQRFAKLIEQVEKDISSLEEKLRKDAAT